MTRTARIVAVANQKGGVGKTTTALNLAVGLSQLDRDVLLIDMDPQGNCTTGLGIELEPEQLSMAEVLLDEASIRQVCVRPESVSIDVAPANQDLTSAEVSLMEHDDRANQLKQSLRSVIDEYDDVLIDCPPALNVLTLNALTAADGVLIPMQCEYYALEGLSALIDTIEQIQASVNPGLQIEGLVRTMYDIRNNLSGAVARQLAENFGDKLYRTIVPRNVRVAESPSYGESVLTYDSESRGAMAYRGLAGEYLNRLETA
ncbi:MAG: ParA family protein [Symploca sp. SIO2G7]|nr:ParA family protein [Symploca sp. SIO2G7]